MNNRLTETKEKKSISRSKPSSTNTSILNGESFPRHHGNRIRGYTRRESDNVVAPNAVRGTKTKASVSPTEKGKEHVKHLKSTNSLFMFYSLGERKIWSNWPPPPQLGSFPWLFFRIFFLSLALRPKDKTKKYKKLEGMSLEGCLNFHFERRHSEVTMNKSSRINSDFRAGGIERESLFNAILSIRKNSCKQTSNSMSPV